MLASIIIPIYKVERYLKECVDSVLRQTYKELEVILVDDGSPDMCPKICNEYAVMDNFKDKIKAGIICISPATARHTANAYRSIKHTFRKCINL